ncbi:MAG: sulfide/dihydroorotate dehydrogenase-like FAD/NAD-binding protein [candidate division WOR-3 bacterium]|nr:sulfide/dihydroorotate dehydrogenase-like FAD/NAD-binding protein [candidate division WOR-3 bacterium]
MVKILKKRQLAPQIKMLELDAPEIARKAQPGQFVVVRVNEEGERIPLTVADALPEQGVLVIVFQEVGKSTMLLGTLEEGEAILDLIGPLGKPSEIERFGTVVCVAGGVGTPEIFPVARALKQAGNRVISIIGFRSRELVLMEEKMRAVSDELIVATDDGSYGVKGFVTDVLREVLNRGEKVDRCFAVGPVIMMKMVSLLTKEYGVPTVVSLNPIMLDATGMCGVCRVEVGGETKFACVDGPEFDGHKVNFDQLMARLKTYVNEEKQAVELFLKSQNCGCEKGTVRG